MTIEAMRAFPAVELFVERAQAVNPVFELSEANAEAVAGICARLDGLPLAIEVIAARTRLLSPGGLLERLHESALLPGTGVRDLPERHRTLRNAVQWSYDLLDETERQVFASLAIFLKGADLEAAAQVCRTQNDGTFEPLGVIASLVDKNLARRQELPDGTVRVYLLETIREFALERLREQPALFALVSERHGQYYSGLARSAEPHLRGSSEMEYWLERVERDHENLLTALDRFAARGELEPALQMGGALWNYWQVRGYWSDGRNELAALLGMTGGQEPLHWVRVQPNPSHAAELLAGVLTGAGTLATRQNDYAEGEALLMQSVQLWRTLVGDASDGVIQARARWGLGMTLGELGFLRQRQHRFESAELSYLESWDLLRALDNWWGLGYASSNLGRVAIQQGHFAEARRWFEKALEIWRALDSPAGISGMLVNLGEVARGEGDLEGARLLYLESLALARRVGIQPRIATVETNLGQIAILEKDFESAVEYLNEALEIYDELGNRSGVNACLAVIGSLAIARGQAQQAAVVFGAIEAFCEASGVKLEYVDRMQLERDLQAIKRALPRKTFEIAWAEGRVMKQEQAVEFARDNVLAQVEMMSTVSD
jgi:predicted ATPase